MIKQITKEDFLEELRNINYEMVYAINNNDKQRYEKYRLLLSNLIKIYEIR